MKYLYILFSTLLLIYMLLPGPSSVDDFSPLPQSVKSDLPGDTWQVSNTSGFFSNEYRDTVTTYFREEYQKKSSIPFAPLRLNYPPEFAFTAVKDQTQSTYLEEYVYPLRGSLFVNGFEPFYEDGTPKYEGAIKLGFADGSYDTKTTIRYYPSPLWARILVWFGIIGVVFLIWRYGRSVFTGE